MLEAIDDVVYLVKNLGGFVKLFIEDCNITTDRQVVTETLVFKFCELFLDLLGVGPDIKFVLIGYYLLQELVVV